MILVVGSVALDTIKTPFGKCRDVLGGSATYFSVSARYFSPVSLVAVVGSDFPKQHIRLFRKTGIDVNGLVAEKGKTFRWDGEYNWDLNNAITHATHLNVFADFDPKIPREYKKSKYVFLANIDPRLQRKVLTQMAKPRLIACDTMNYWIENRRRELTTLLKEVDIFLLNEAEARQLTGQSSIMKAAREIQKLGPGVIIIKKGEHGSILLSRRYVFSVPAYPMENVFDPTGAGDTFAGGVLGYLAQCGTLCQSDLRKAVVYGTIMATFAVESFSLGCLGSITKSDIRKRYKEFEKLTHF